jgi:hypothetical protein
MRRVPELKFEGKRPTVQPTAVVSNVLGIRVKSREREKKKSLLTTLQIIPIFLLQIMPFINSAKI